MKDNFFIETRWYDEVEDFFEVELISQNDSVQVRGTYYLSNQQVEEFRSVLQTYLIESDKNQTFASGDFLPQTTASFGVTLFPAEYDGSVRLLMDMEVRHTIYPNRRYQVDLSTTLYHLEKFHKQLRHVCQKYSFTKLALHDG